MYYNDYIKVYHKVEMINNKYQIVIYVDYPYEYEFGDFNIYKEKVSDISDSVKKYVINNLKSLKDAFAILVLNGVIIGTFSISNILGSNIDSNKTFQETQKVQTYLMPQNIKKIEIKLADAKLEEIEPLSENENISQELEKVTTDTSLSNNSISLVSNNNKINKGKNSNNTEKKLNNTSKKASNVNINDQKSDVNTNTNTNTSTNTNTNNQSSSSQTYDVNNNNYISVKLNNGEIVSLPLEEYVTGVVCSEMPALFNSEALKAQSVAARTYAMKKKAYGGILSASTEDQVYKTNDELKAMWGQSFNTYYNKVKFAVEQTSGEVMMYNGKYIDALYFSTSNGRTEDPIYVWNYSAPYLKSVDSKWDVGGKFYNATKTFSKEELSKQLGVNLTSLSQITINSYTIGNRVNSITIASKEFTGVQIRSLLGLRSADFTIKESGDNIIFETKGWGHGVGMSQYGANGMANAGYNYTQILKHYYTGISIVKK